MDHGEETNPVRGDEKSLMGVGVKHKLVLKTDHLGWGPSTALFESSERNRKSVGKLPATIC